MKRLKSLIFSQNDITYLLTIEDAHKNLRLNKLLKSKISEIFPGNYNYFVKTKFGDTYDIHYPWSWSTNLTIQLIFNNKIGISIYSKRRRDDSDNKRDCIPFVKAFSKVKLMITILKEKKAPNSIKEIQFSIFSRHLYFIIFLTQDYFNFNYWSSLLFPFNS